MPDLHPRGRRIDTTMPLVLVAMFAYGAPVFIESRLGDHRRVVEVGEGFVRVA